MNWNNDAILLLDELVQPIPLFVRPMAKRSIKKKVEEIAAGEKANSVDSEHVVHGYIVAAPKKDIQRIMDFLDSKNIDYSKYAHLLS